MQIIRPAEELLKIGYPFWKSPAGPSGAKARLPGHLSKLLDFAE